MAHKIGFTVEHTENKPVEVTNVLPQKQIIPRRSLVQVYFKDVDKKFAYYNDQFDLHYGDLVYVEGNMEGKQGRVTEVNYNFKIKLSDYKRVVAVADTNVKGQFHFAGSHFVTFDRNALPSDKVRAWFKPPCNDEEEFVSGSDDSFFLLSDLGGMNVSNAIADRGHEYYMDNRVRYISIDGNKGYALVQGSEVYEIEFMFYNSEVSQLTCSCFCSYNCKHEFATMLQLRETLGGIGEFYEAEYERTGYFAAILKGTLLQYAIDGKESGTFTL